MRVTLNKHPVIINYLQVDAINQISEDTDVLLMQRTSLVLSSWFHSLFLSFCVLLWCMKNNLKSEKDWTLHQQKLVCVTSRRLMESHIENKFSNVGSDVCELTNQSRLDRKWAEPSSHLDALLCVWLAADRETAAVVLWFSPCWYCTMYPSSLPLGSSGGVQWTISDLSVGLSNVSDAGGPGATQTHRPHANSG